MKSAHNSLRMYADCCQQLVKCNCSTAAELFHWKSVNIYFDMSETQTSFPSIAITLTSDVLSVQAPFFSKPAKHPNSTLFQQLKGSPSRLRDQCQAPSWLATPQLLSSIVGLFSHLVRNLGPAAESKHAMMLTPAAYKIEKPTGGTQGVLKDIDVLLYEPEMFLRAFQMPTSYWRNLLCTTI